MPWSIKLLILSLCLSVPTGAFALSLGSLQLHESGSSFHAQVLLQLAEDESLADLQARLATPQELPKNHHLSHPLNPHLALALTPVGHSQAWLDIRGEDSAMRMPFSFLLMLQLENGLVLKQFDVFHSADSNIPQVRETLLSHIFSHDDGMSTDVAGHKTKGGSSSHLQQDELQQLEQELAQAKSLEMDLKQQNKMLRDNIQQMEKLAGDIAQQLGLFAQMRDQQASNSGAAPVFIDQTADSSSFTGTTLGSISALALLLAGFAFREKLKLAELGELLKRWASGLFKHNKPA